MRREREDLQRELEKDKLEATNKEVKIKIDYLKAPSIIFPSTDPNKPPPQHVSHPVVKIQLTLPVNIVLVNQVPSINQNNQVPITHGPNMKMNMGNNPTGNQFQRRPINLELYRQLFFEGIQRYPNHVPTELKDKLQKFASNNAISAEEHLKSFGDMIDDYKISNEDVIMKLFVQSLVDDARDWYKGLPINNINSWEEFKNCF